MTSLRLLYDSADRNRGMEQYDSTTTGHGIYYDRDAQDRVISRLKRTVANGTWTDAGKWQYGFTGTGDTPDFVKNSSGTIIQKTLQLPGSVLLTLQPTDPQPANQKQYSLPNLHDDVLLLTDAGGANTSTGNGPANSYLYDPFGNPIPGSTLPTNTPNGSYGYVGQHEKLTESNFALTPIQMGARVYLPTIGRFAQVDPIEGGTENNYVYPTDPVNEYDLTGTIGWKKWFKDRKQNAINTRNKISSWCNSGGAKSLSCDVAIMAATRGQGKGARGGAPIIPRRAGQVNRDIQKGLAPKSMIRADVGRSYKERSHIHFKGGHALNQNGTWKHGGRPLTKSEREYIQRQGWRLPK